MERLTERVFGFIQLKACGNDFCTETCAEQNEEKSCKNCPIQKAFEKLATYEDLEEQGLLFRLPCKVGDILYAIDGKTIQTLKADIALRSGRLCIFAENCHYADYFCYNDLGKTVFLTQAEAEQALKEMDGDSE